VTCRLFVTVLVGLCCAPALSAEVRPWEVFELALTATAEGQVGYVEGLPDGGPCYLTVEFRGEGGAAQGQQYTVAGFWDGDRTWRVRFAPPAAGAWSYATHSADPGLDGQTGQLACADWTDEQKQANPTRRGLVRVCRTGPRAGRYFEYADGTPMLWLGDTWWNWGKSKIPLERFQKLVDDRSAKGFNVGQLFFAAHGWGPDSWLLDRTFTQPQLDRIRHVEQMIAYANAKGITVWVHGWWAREEMDQRVGAENVRRWTRYMVHRLSAWNVIWVLAGEYNMHNYGGLGLDFWKDLGQLVADEDPYDRLLSAHPTPPGWGGGAEAPQWSTAEVLHGEPWLNYNQSQVGHGRWRNELIPGVVAFAYRQEPAKPIVVTEPWYEFVEGNPPAADIRFGGWSALLSGAAGHSYGGGHVWRGHVPESPEQRGSWPLQTGFETDTLDYPGARALSSMAKFLRSLDWWQLEPHPELLSENPSPYCSAVPGSQYVAFLRWGGVAKLDLRPSSPEDTFAFTWLDLTEDRPARSGTVAGGAIRSFSPPEDYPGAEQFKDWVLHVVKQTDPAP